MHFTSATLSAIVLLAPALSLAGACPGVFDGPNSSGCIGGAYYECVGLRSNICIAQCGDNTVCITTCQQEVNSQCCMSCAYVDSCADCKANFKTCQGLSDEDAADICTNGGFLDNDDDPQWCSEDCIKENGE